MSSGASGGCPRGVDHDVFLRDRSAGSAADLALNVSFAHDEHTVADPDDLRQFARNDDQADPVRGELVDDAVDLGFSADVDAPGRLVEDQQLGADLEPA